MFQNYEIDKLIIPYPLITNSLILSLFLLIALSSLKRKSNFEIIDSIVTDQARGLAVFFLVIGHLWSYVVNSKSDIFYAIISDGLTIFLICSGYGVYKSTYKDGFKLNAFILKRINRIMIPYWATTVLFIVLDYIILGRSYKVSHILFSILGINLYDIMHHFDFVRWFITFLLFWYSVVVISRLYCKNKYIDFMPFFIGIVLFLLDYYFLKFGWTQYIAFPLGWWLARNEQIYKLLLNKFSKGRSWVFIVLIFLFIYIKYVWSTVYIGKFPGIFHEFSNDLLLCVSSLCFLNLFIVTKKYSRILVFLGSHSYEIFLLHGVFLVKYNPFFQNIPLPVSFYFYLLFIVTISWLMKKSLKNIKLPVHAPA
jgi:probable poly-beta-1,6-N-acetyl-D-glucosamine export protein